MRNFRQATSLTKALAILLFAYVVIARLFWEAGIRVPHLLLTSGLYESLFGSELAIHFSVGLQQTWIKMYEFLALKGAILAAITGFIALVREIKQENYNFWYVLYFLFGGLIARFGLNPTWFPSEVIIALKSLLLFLVIIGGYFFRKPMNKKGIICYILSVAIALLGIYLLGWHPFV